MSSFYIFILADEKNADKSVTAQTANQQCRVKMLAIPLPKTVTDLLETNNELLKSATQVSNLSDRVQVRLKELRDALSSAFKESSEAPEIYQMDDIVDRIWAFGPKKCGTNILLNLSTFKHQNIWNSFELQKKETQQSETERDPRNDLENAFTNGYQLATLAGPLCEEPMHGVCFLVEKWDINDVSESSLSIGSLAGKQRFYFFGQIILIQNFTGFLYNFL